MPTGWHYAAVNGWFAVFPWDTLIAVGIGIVAFAWGVAAASTPTN